MRKVILVFLGALLVLMLSGAGFVWLMLQPSPESLPLPDSLIALETPEGQVLLARSIKADHGPLAAQFQSQQYRSYCGVASSVITLNAMGKATNQDDFFTPEATAVTRQVEVMFGGMTLDTLAGLLSAHGVDAQAMPGDELSVDALRATVRSNLGHVGDFVLVNYQRSAVGQVEGGHISPLAAYDAETDRVLILDTATYRYPPVWVELESLHASIATTDPTSGKSRGIVVVAAAK